MTQWDILTGAPDRDRRNVAILMESVADLYGPWGVEEITRHAVDRAILVTGAQRGLLLLENEGRLVPVVGRQAGGRDLPLDAPYSSTVVEKVRASGAPFLTVDAEDESTDSLGRSILDLRLLSIMAVPLTVKGRRLGLLYVDSTLQAKEFTQADFAVFRALAGLIALAVENARLLTEHIEKERLERDLAAGREIQRRFLPKDLVVPAGYDLAGDERPCTETSGDYYDVIPLANGNLALVVGDVSGHGVGPALTMASTRALLHALLAGAQEPAQVLRTVNAFLSRDMPDDAFMSLFIGVLEPAARRLRYVSAGHNPPLLVRADGEMSELVCTGPVLAVLGDADYTVSDPVPLDSGDTLVLYTDGIYEAHGPEGVLYGEDRFQASLLRHARETTGARDLIEGLLGDLDAFIQRTPLVDDLTCLVLRVK